VVYFFGPPCIIAVRNSVRALYQHRIDLVERLKLCFLNRLWYHFWRRNDKKNGVFSCWLNTYRTKSRDA